MYHECIWHAIDKIAAQKNLTCSGLARMAGLDPTLFNKSKRITRDGKPHTPSMSTIIKLIDSSGMTLAEFENLMWEDNSSKKR